MATTAKQSSSVRGSSTSPAQSATQFTEGEEDIETIAKQISDHAEAIYQTWKARGLAPTEILNCHTGNSDTFGKTLTPSLPSPILQSNQHYTKTTIQQQQQNYSNLHQQQQQQQQYNRNKESPVAELFAQTPDMSNNNNLEKLVSSFVNEDKARQQAARKNSILTSGTIKDALRKFECVDRTVNVKPNFLRNSSPQPNRSSSNGLGGNGVGGSISGNGVNVGSTSISCGGSTASTANTTTTVIVQQSNVCATSNNSVSNKLNKNVPDVLMNTIDKVLPTAASSNIISAVGSKEHSPPKQKPETPAKPASLLNHQPSWPLKNRLGIVASTTSLKKDSVNNSSVNNHSNDEVDNHRTVAKRLAAEHKKSADLMDEVLMEEERLINALKTGTVLNNDKPLPEVITSTLNDNSTNSIAGKSWTKPDISTTAMSSSSASSIVVTNNDSNQSWNNDTDHHYNKPVTNNSNNLASVNNGVGVQIVHDSIGSNNNNNSTSSVVKIIKRPRNDAAVPHPEVNVNINKLNITSVTTRGASVNPAVRPFLTRGSVAERVLMFEKCPEVKALRNTPKDPKLSTKPLAKPNESHTTLQRHIRGSKNVYIPRFHYPQGKPLPSISIEQTFQRLQAAFDSHPNKQVTKENFTSILKICALPFYWRMPLYSCAQLTPGGLCDGKKFCEFWKQMSVYCHDATSRFVFILSHGQRSRPYILPEDLVTLVQDVVDTHPGLAFLKEAAEFHSRYVHTVIARIFYTVNRSWSGKITLPELRRSNLLQVLQLLEEEEDINQIMAYFSYEHFYVIYCKFWELDRDHDLFIDQNDLARHNDHALSTRIIERIFSGCVTKGVRNRTGPGAQKMSYTEFVWFLLSEEDKTHPTAVEYWFRCMDLDGDGVLSMYELEYFYEEQQHRMESIGIETLPFEDCLCQMLDMIKPMRSGFVTLGDLKRCKMTPIFFDTFFNLEKYMEHEQRDPFATQRDQDEMTDWDRFAAQEYELLVAEEGGDTQGSYDEDDEYESNIDILESQLDDCMSSMINEW